MEQTVRAPQLDSPLGWLNTDRPMRIGHELKGHVVLLDFWTYCCINCIHILPDLKFLENKYAAEPFVVIGVHSAKFANESSRQTIRSAIHRYEIEHPVVVDDAMAIWRAYGARSWPTFALIDPEGYLVAHTAGEGQRDVLDEAVAELLAAHRTKGTLATERVSLRRDASVEPATGLAFPGKVLADAARKRLFIADSNHNRIVTTSWPDDRGRCTLIKTIGSGDLGDADGPAESATFDHPQGLAVSADTLYVADTENHTIRAVDLTSWQVTTVVGTGEMGYDRAGGAMGTQQPISSPWDLAVEGGTLYVAMAGLHQIWRVEMPVGFARALAGSGRENIVDGPVETAALSQPSGLCLHRGKLYVADSEVSAIREIDLAAEQVTTLVGQGLFVFGDVDGPTDKAKLQHPLGVSSWNDVLLVADTYNHKIKKLHPSARQVTTLYGLGLPATSTPDNHKPGFFEPGGLCVSGDTLFVADTNNHRIVRVDLTTDDWAELTIDGLRSPSAATEDAAGQAIIDAPKSSIGPDRATSLSITVELPGGAHLNHEAPWTIRVTSSDEVLAQVTGFDRSFPLVVNIPPQSQPADQVWQVAASFVYCTADDEALCIPAEATWQIPITLVPTAESAISLRTSAIIRTP